MVQIKTTSRQKRTGVKTTSRTTSNKKNKSGMFPHLAKLGLSSFFRRGPPTMSKQTMSKQTMRNNIPNLHFLKKGKKTRRKMRQLKFKVRHIKVGPLKPIKTIIPSWIDKKYIKNGMVDWGKYMKD